MRRRIRIRDKAVPVNSLSAYGAKLQNAMAIVDLHNRGLSFKQIAAHLALKESTVRNYYWEAIREISAEYDTNRTLLWAKHLQEVESDIAYLRKSKDRATLALKRQYMDDRAKLLGLYPESNKINVEVDKVIIVNAPFANSPQVQVELPRQEDTPLLGEYSESTNSDSDNGDSVE